VRSRALHSRSRDLDQNGRASGKADTGRSSVRESPAIPAQYDSTALEGAELFAQDGGHFRKQPKSFWRREYFSRLSA
jgi:hypothetical protein